MDYKILLCFFFGIGFCLSCMNQAVQEKLNAQTYVQEDSSKCNIAYVVAVEKSLDNLEDDDLLRFLKTFDESCRPNVEFSEYSNEVLLKVVTVHPEQFLTQISNKGVDKDLILLELKTPINDLYDKNDLEEIIKELEKK